MQDTAAATFNGVELNVPLLGLLRGKASYKVVERVAEFNVAISFFQHRCGIAAGRWSRLDCISRGSSEPLRVDRTLSYRSHLKIVDTIDAVFQANPAAPVYSGALADDIGVSVRTLHNAVTRFRGVSSGS